MGDSLGSTVSRARVRPCGRLEVAAIGHGLPEVPMRPVLSLMLPLLLVGCGEEGDLRAEKDLLERKLAEVVEDRARLEREADRLHARTRKLGDEVRALRVATALSTIGIAPGDPLAAVLETSRGQVHCELFPEKSPMTVQNFVQLAEGTKAWTHPTTGERMRTPLYSGTLIHRVKPRFMVQMGDPLGTGAGGPGFTFGDETDNGLTFTEPGLLAMANRGPDTNGSQFFVTDRGTPNHLDGKHTIFGKCEDAAVVQTIAETPRDEATDRPEVEVVLKRVRIVRGR